uniref:Uncharacterized protein n=1 Tax=Neogobius melanostomus TaxID=47308 RepID=A0A8C6WI72_9GOBI
MTSDFASSLASSRSGAHSNLQILSLTISRKGYSSRRTLQFSNLSDTCCPALASILSTKESCLTELDLGFNSISDTGVQSLVQGLKEQDCRLKSLRLQGCELTSSACEHLATALKQSPELKELELSCNDIGDVGLQHLASGLETPSCQLETLRYMYVFNVTLLEVEENNLVDLNLSSNRLKDSGVHLIMAGLFAWSTVEKLK